MGENIHVLNASSQPSFQTGETMLTKTLQSAGQILKGMLIARSYKLICVGRLGAFVGEKSGFGNPPTQGSSQGWDRVIVDPLIRHIPPQVRLAVGNSNLAVAALKASQHGSRFNFILPGEYIILLCSVNVLISWILYEMTIAANKSVKG